MDSNVTFRYRHPNLAFEAIIPKADWVNEQSLSFQQDISNVVKIVNTAYEHGEYGMWKGDTMRINDKEVLNRLQNEKLLLLTKTDEQDKPIGERIHGCIHVDWDYEEGCCQLGTFAIDEANRGKGIGKFLMRAAEVYALTLKDCTSLQLEILSPMEYEHEIKVRLDRWYTSLGFKTDRVDRFPQFQKDYVHICEKLACKCKFWVYEKRMMVENFA